VANVVRPASAGLASGAYGRVTTAWAEGDARPIREKPQLALVLIARPGQGAPSVGSESVSDLGSTGDGAPASWVFPFNKPPEPGTGDNQALAVNTRCGHLLWPRLSA